MTRLKPGVSLKGLQPQMAVALAVVASIFEHYGADCIVTSGSDGQHSQNSLHYEGLALDFRRRHLQPGEVQSILSSMKAYLGAEFDVVLESTHFHVEYDPK